MFHARVLGDTRNVTTMSTAASSKPADATRAKRRIFVVEDHEFMRRNMVATLEREPALSVCGVADDVPAALTAIVTLQPDLVLTDLALRSSSGLDLIRTLRTAKPALPVVATTMFDRRVNERAARAAGATTFVCKQDGPDALVAAVHAAFGGSS
jgi:DNA-binding NarL/FixJ family response regulator